MAWHIPIYGWLIHAAIQSFLVFALGWLAVVCCREPARRIRVIRLTLVACLAAPGLGMIPGYPHCSFAWWADDGPEQVATVAGPAPPSAISIDETRAEAAEPSREVRFDRRSGSAAAKREAAFGTARFSRAARWLRTSDPRLAVVVGYLSVVGLLTGWYLTGILRLARIVCRSRAAPASCRELFGRIAGPSGDRVTLLVTDRARQPFTFPWWHPVIVLPDEVCGEGDTQSVRWCLTHEWSHVVRGDTWIWSLAGATGLLFFYQPLSWWLRRQLRLSGDYMADALAAEQTSAAEDYAEFLTTRAARSTLRPAVGSLGMGCTKSELYRRVVMLLENPRPLERTCPRVWNLSVAVLAMVLVGAVSTLGEAPGVRADARTAGHTETTREPARRTAETPSEVQAEVGPSATAVGRLLDVKLRPLAERRIICYYGSPEEGASKYHVETVSDGQGRFRIPGLPVGSHCRITLLMKSGRRVLLGPRFIVKSTDEIDLDDVLDRLDFYYSSPTTSGDASTGMQTLPRVSEGTEDKRDALGKAFAELAKVYRLSTDEDLKRFVAPHPAERATFIQAHYPSNSGPSWAVALTMPLHHDKLRSGSASIGSAPSPLKRSIESIVKSVCDVYPQEIEGDEKLIRTQVEGDFVVRLGVAPQKLVSDLERILRTECDLPVRLSLREEERKVIVTSGQYEYSPVAGYKGIVIYGKALVPDSGAGGGSGDFDKFLQSVGSFIGRRLVSDLQDPPKNRLSWSYHRRSPFTAQMRKEDTDQTLVLKHLTEQTGLEFREETRKVRVLLVERD